MSQLCYSLAALHCPPESNGMSKGGLVGVGEATQGQERQEAIYASKLEEARGRVGPGTQGSLKLWEGPLPKSPALGYRI